MNILSDRIIHELKIQLKVDGINPKTALTYFNLVNNEEISFFKTDNDQKTLGWIRDLLQNIKVFLRVNGGNKIIGVAYFAHNNRNKIPANSRGFQRPKEMLAEKLK